MIKINDRLVDAVQAVSVANDKDVIKLEFTCKNQVTELLKLTDCTAVYINYNNGGVQDKYLVTDLSENDGVVTFSWTLGANATRKTGKTLFVICAQITDGNEVLQEWNTIRSSFDVQKGLETVTQPPKPMQDLFTQLVEIVRGKLDTNQGRDNAGKVMTVDENGNAVPKPPQGGGSSVEIVQTTGESKTAVMSQKATTDALHQGLKPLSEGFNQITSLSGKYYAPVSCTVGFNDDNRIVLEAGDIISYVFATGTDDWAIQGIRTSGILFYGDNANFGRRISVYNSPSFMFQEVGQSKTATMSQKAISEAIALKQDALTAGNGVDLTGDVASVKNDGTLKFTDSQLGIDFAEYTVNDEFVSSTKAIDAKHFNDYMTVVQRLFGYAIDNKADKSNTYTKTQIDTALAGKQAVGDYATNTALTSGLATKQNTLIPAENMDIKNGVISAKTGRTPLDLSDETSPYRTEDGFDITRLSEGVYDIIGGGTICNPDMVEDGASLDLVEGAILNVSTGSSSHLVTVLATGACYWFYTDDENWSDKSFITFADVESGMVSASSYTAADLVALDDGLYRLMTERTYRDVVNNTNYSVSGFIEVKDGVHYVYNLGLKFSGLSRSAQRISAKTVEPIYVGGDNV